MSDPILPFDVWDESTEQNSVPANDNSLRLEILNGNVISESTDAQPGSPSDGDIYIITGSATGAQWTTFDQYDLAIFYDGTWYAYAPVEGIVVNVAGVLKRWTGSAYTFANAPLASPVFTGNPTAPTPAVGDDDASIATTNFVQRERHPRYCFEALCDFTSASLGTASFSPFIRSNNGTGATISPTAGTASSPGRAYLDLGTTTTGRAAVTMLSSALVLGGGAVRYMLKGCLRSLSDGTDTFTQWNGLVNDVTAGPGRGCFFRYTHSVNGGRWEAVCVNATVETAVDTGITAIAGTERTFDIRINAAGSEATFYIDGNLVATINTNMPTSSIGAAIAAVRSAGTASKHAMEMDVIYVRQDFTTPRW